MRSQICRYTSTTRKHFEKVANVRLKTKPEPWLHLICTGDKPGQNTTAKLYYAVYVWDTRQVIEEGEITVNFGQWLWCVGHPIGTEANDNHEPLKTDNKALLQAMQKQSHNPENKYKELYAKLDQVANKYGIATLAKVPAAIGAAKKHHDLRMQLAKDCIDVLTKFDAMMRKDYGDWYTKELTGGSNADNVKKNIDKLKRAMSTGNFGDRTTLNALYCEPSYGGTL